MTGPPVCALTWCASPDGTRRHVQGLRCRVHSPSAMAGVPEPEQLLAEHRHALARHAGTDTTGRNAA